VANGQRQLSRYKALVVPDSAGYLNAPLRTRGAVEVGVEAILVWAVGLSLSGAALSPAVTLETELPMPLKFLTWVGTRSYWEREGREYLRKAWQIVPVAEMWQVAIQKLFGLLRKRLDGHGRRMPRFLPPPAQTLQC